MSRKRFDDMNCQVAQALDQIGDWWTLLIVRDATFGARRFIEFQKSLGIARNILAERLRRLVANGILVREDTDPPGRYREYRLTEKGRDLVTVLTALRLWADKWVYGEGNEPVVVVHRDTGAAVSKLQMLDDKGRAVEIHELVATAGPGASPQTLRRLAKRRTQRAKGAKPSSPASARIT